MQSLDKVDFDFSSLYELLQDMKRSFWTIERQQERFVKSLSRQHNNYYQKLIPEKRKQAEQEKQALVLKNPVLISQIKKRTQIKKLILEEDLAQEMARREAQEFQYQKKVVNNGPVKDLEATLANTVLDRMSNLQSPIKNDRTLSVRFDETIKNNKQKSQNVQGISAAKTMMNKKLIGGLPQDVDSFNEAIQNFNTIKVEDNNTLGKIEDKTSSVQSPNKRKITFKTLDGLINRSGSKNFKFTEILGNKSFTDYQSPSNKAQVSQTWFQNVMIDQDLELDRSAAEIFHLEAFSKVKDQIDKLFTDKLKTIQYYDFHKIIQDKKIREKVCERLFENNQARIPLLELMDTIKDSDKDLFMKFRDQNITYDQLKARIAERRFKVTYKCLDDLKEKLDPQFYTDMEAFEPYFKMIYGSKQPISHKDILRDLQPYESNKRCLRSVKHQHQKNRGTKKNSHFFISIGRDKGRNMFKIPDQPNLEQINNMEKLLFQIKTEEEKLQNQSALGQKQKRSKTQGQKSQKDQELLIKEFQIENIRKLKKTLIAQLWQHKILEHQNMPYISSSITFQDQKESFFFGLDAVKPEVDEAQKKFLKSKNQKLQSSKSRNSSMMQQNGDNSGSNPISLPQSNIYLTNYEIKKYAALEQKKNILFMKRLESEGRQIRIHQQDKDLLRFYGDTEEEEAQKELDSAIVSDLLGKPAQLINPDDKQYQLALKSLANTEEAAIVYKQEVEKLKLKELTWSSAKTYAIPQFDQKKYELQQKQKKDAALVLHQKEQKNDNQSINVTQISIMNQNDDQKTTSALEYEPLERQIVLKKNENNALMSAPLEQADRDSTNRLIKVQDFNNTSQTLQVAEHPLIPHPIPQALQYLSESNSFLDVTQNTNQNQNNTLLQQEENFQNQQINAHGFSINQNDISQQDIQDNQFLNISPDNNLMQELQQQYERSRTADQGIRLKNFKTLEYRPVTVHENKMQDNYKTQNRDKRIPQKLLINNERNIDKNSQQKMDIDDTQTLNQSVTQQSNFKNLKNLSYHDQNLAFRTQDNFYQSKQTNLNQFRDYIDGNDFQIPNSNFNTIQSRNNNRNQVSFQDHNMNINESRSNAYQTVTSTYKNQDESKLFVTEVGEDFKNFANTFGIPLPQSTMDNQSNLNGNQSALRTNSTRAGTANSINKSRRKYYHEKINESQLNIKQAANPSFDRLKTALALNKQQRIQRVRVNQTLQDDDLNTSQLSMMKDDRNLNQSTHQYNEQDSQIQNNYLKTQNHQRNQNNVTISNFQNQSIYSDQNQYKTQQDYKTTAIMHRIAEIKKTQNIEQFRRRNIMQNIKEKQQYSTTLRIQENQLQNQNQQQQNLFLPQAHEQKYVAKLQLDNSQLNMNSINNIEMIDQENRQMNMKANYGNINSQYNRSKSLSSHQSINNNSSSAAMLLKKQQTLQQNQ
eukprot:403342601